VFPNLLDPASRMIHWRSLCLLFWTVVGYAILRLQVLEAGLAKIFFGWAALVFSRIGLQPCPGWPQAIAGGDAKRP